MPAPRRVRGIRVQRQIPVAPEPALPKPPTEDVAEEKFATWAAQYGGTYPEFLVFEYLVEVAGLVYGVDFMYQSSQQGGRRVLGGAVVDFEVRPYQVYIRVQGMFFHVGDPALEGRDVISKISIESATGWKVVDVFETDLYERRDYTMERALAGRQIRHLGE